MSNNNSNSSSNDNTNSNNNDKHDDKHNDTENCQTACSRRGVQWMGVELHNKHTTYKSLHPVSAAPPFDES